jgi:hypothetical protein
MNQELYSLYLQDRQEHGQGFEAGTPEYDAMRRRDRDRRKRAGRILKDEASPDAEDFYHAAWLFNHGETEEEARRAHNLARRAAELGHRPAKWLTAATYDRWQMYQGKPQKYGTQIVPDGKRYRLWDVDPDTTDPERARWDVPPLAEQQKRAAALTKSTPQPPMEEAPQWLKEAIDRWRKNG